MFYQFQDEVTTVDVSEINSHYVTAGYVTAAEFDRIYDKFGFSASTVDAVKSGNMFFHSRFGVEVYDDYCFTKMSVINALDVNGERDIIAIYIKKNLLIVVDVQDKDCSTRDKFLACLDKYSPINITLEKLIYAFLDNLTNKDNKAIEDKGLRSQSLKRSCFTAMPAIILILIFCR